MEEEGRNTEQQKGRKCEAFMLNGKSPLYSPSLLLLGWVWSRVFQDFMHTPPSWKYSLVCDKSENSV